MKLQIFQHVPFEGAGAIIDWAQARGYSVQTTHWYELDARVPAIAEVDFLVVMGGPMSVHDTDVLPWLRLEKAYLREYVQSGRPMIGVCLGAQLLAEALGGTISQNAFEEVGWFPVELTPEARALWPTLPPSLTPLHWHGETFTLPDGATRLMQNKACANQGFLARGNLLGLQCHIEANEASTRAFVDACPQGKIPNPSNSPYVATAESLLEGVATYAAGVHAALYTMLDSIAKPAPASAA